MKQRATYLSLSAAAGHLELGASLILLRSGAPLAFLLVAGLCYQVGALCTARRHIEAGLIRLLLGGAALLAAAHAFAPDSPHWGVIAVTLLLAIGLQNVREAAGVGAGTSTAEKRLARVAGFATAGFASDSTFLLVAVVCLTASYFVSQPPQKHVAPTRRKWSRLTLLMVVHQSHYFAYAYVVPYLFAGLGFSYGSVALVFVSGWLSYVGSPLLFARMRPAPGFVVGHILAASMLLLIWLGMHTPPVAIIGWIGTGFGGGTVFLLRQRALEQGELTVDMDEAENIGHVTGAIVGLVLVTIGIPFGMTFVAAASLALIAAAVMVVDMIDRGTGATPLVSRANKIQPR